MHMLPVNHGANAVCHHSLRVYAMLWSLFREVGRWFPDEYVHLGGDEVPFDCWKVRSWWCLVETSSLLVVHCRVYPV